MKYLREGMIGFDVKRWQLFLRGLGVLRSEVDGSFGPGTVAATKAFQSARRLVADGVVGLRTLGAAMLEGYPAFSDADDQSPRGPNWPRPPAFSPLTTTLEREAVFGSFDYRPAPTPDSLETIRILGDWEAKNVVLVTVPQLVGVSGAPADGRIAVHRLVADQVLELWAAWQSASLLDRVLTWDGSFARRFARGSMVQLSNHAFGAAFDINAARNRLGAQPALVGEVGSVRELVPIANQLGFFWGGHFRTRPDGMHFELAVVKEG